MKSPLINRSLQCAAAVLLALGCTWTLAAGTVEVIYVHPDSYTDLGETQEGRDQALVVLTEHLQKMADRLPQGQRLRLEITDIDLAGSPNPALAENVRQFSGGGDRPQIRLRYQLRAGEQTLKSGEANIYNVNYLQHRRPTYQGVRELVHERRMLDDWFDGLMKDR